MACIFFFSIPAHGHVNPTLPLVRELTARGHRVIYYETEEFREKIKNAGAEFVSIEPYMPPAPENIDRIAGRDFAALIGMVAQTTLGLDSKIAEDIARERPALIIGDSLSSDMKGGLNAGIDTCWYNPKGKAADPNVPVTYEVRSFEEIRALLSAEN